jgi:hypothetical protein
MKPDEQIEKDLVEAAKEITAVCKKYGLILTDSMGCYALELISEQNHANGDRHVLSMAFDANED